MARKNQSMTSHPSLRERKKQKTRWAIQEHALRLFAEQGYDATTVDQIAAAAEISPSTFFRYFRTKEDVVIEDEYDALMAGLAAAAPPEISPVAALRHAIQQGFGAMGDDDLRKMSERTKLIMSVPALRARSLENMLDSIDMIAVVIGHRLDRDPKDFPVRVVAGAVLGVLLASMRTWLESDGEASILELMDRGLAELDAGLKV
jgi:AcrR family transcriptional regulator